MKVVLFEKPQQALTFAEAFIFKHQNTHIEIETCDIFNNEETVFVWALGHLAELCSPHDYKEEWKTWSLETLPIIPEKFKYQVSADKRKLFNNAKHWLQKADEIIIATDAGRAGEAIARNLIMLSGTNNKPQKRLWTSSQTKDAVRKAFSNLKDAKDFHSYYLEEQARAYSDWMIGMNASRVYTLLFNKHKGVKEVFSAGRIQSALLCLIRSREEEIEQFKPRDFYEVIANFGTGAETYIGKYITEKGSKLARKEDALKILQHSKNKSAFIHNVDLDEKKTIAPKLHNLSSLQAKMNRKYKIPPKKLLDILQILYDKRYVTYPRSEYQFLPTEEAKELPIAIAKLGKLHEYSSLVANKQRDTIVNLKAYVDDSKVGDHYAIVITENIPKLENLSDPEKKVYDEIARSVLATFYGPHVYNQTDVITKIEDFHFKSVGKQIVQQGWKVVFGKEENEKNESTEEAQSLPNLQVGQNVTVKSIDIKQGKTQPLKPYTEGQLITLMASKKVATEATRSGIIERVKELSYITISKNNVYTTNKGKMMVEAVRHTPIGSTELTANWEEYLKQIGEGKADAGKFIAASKEMTKKIIQDAQSQVNSWNVDGFVEAKKTEHHIGKCPVCGKAIVDKKSFYGCTGYKKDHADSCTFSLPKAYLSKEISIANIQRILEKGKSNLIKGFKSKNKPDAEPFEAYLIIKNGQLQLEFANKKKKKKTKSS
ncbi:type IA DNA topoisomerase [Bacillus paramycoides]|uniref:type IA DNA topoisomerase n=1 Tax=Bacillus paramycoides TaxID=2026194 RepID=UPI002E21C80A|nr:DNA topoisomerase [Bacillus paramycoides]MED1107685.1 DNA topoisomerase [Bacillus paramycoides]